MLSAPWIVAILVVGIGVMTTVRRMVGIRQPRGPNQPGGERLPEELAGLYASEQDAEAHPTHSLLDSNDIKRHHEKETSAHEPMDRQQLSPEDLNAAVIARLAIRSAKELLFWGLLNAIAAIMFFQNGSTWSMSTILKNTSPFAPLLWAVCCLPFAIATIQILSGLFFLSRPQKQAIVVAGWTLIVVGVFNILSRAIFATVGAVSWAGMEIDAQVSQVASVLGVFQIMWGAVFLAAAYRLGTAKGDVLRSRAGVARQMLRKVSREGSNPKLGILKCTLRGHIAFLPIFRKYFVFLIGPKAVFVETWLTDFFVLDSRTALPDLAKTPETRSGRFIVHLASPSDGLFYKASFDKDGYEELCRWDSEANREVVRAMGPKPRLSSTPKGASSQQQNRGLSVWPIVALSCLLVPFWLLAPVVADQYRRGRNIFTDDRLFRFLQIGLENDWEIESSYGWFIFAFIAFAVLVLLHAWIGKLLRCGSVVANRTPYK
jgi:hypothetical protein